MTHITRQRMIALAVSWGALWLLFLFTRPEKLPFAILILPFILIWLGFYNLFMLISEFRQSRRGVGPGRGARLLSALLAAVLAVSVGLQSLGELTTRDFLVVALLFAVAYFYMKRNTSESEV